MAGTVLPPAEASSIIARRNRTELVLPRRTTCCSFCLSCLVSMRTRTDCAIPPPHPTGSEIASNRLKSHQHHPGERSRSQQ
jgi:hypothetical protein